MHCLKHCHHYAVLERPSSQISYLDHILKESGGKCGSDGVGGSSIHTVSSVLGGNMVSLINK